MLNTYTCTFYSARQIQQQNTLKAQEIQSTSGQPKTVRGCTKCKAPMKGHPRGRYPGLEA